MGGELQMQRSELLTAFAAPAGAKFGAQDIVLRDRLCGKRRGRADQGQDLTHHDANIGSMARIRNHNPAKPCGGKP